MSYLGWTPWSSLEVIMPPVSIMRNQINHEEDDVNRTECRRKPKEDIRIIMTVACILRTRWRSFSVWRVSYPVTRARVTRGVTPRHEMSRADVTMSQDHPPTSTRPGNTQFNKTRLLFVYKKFPKNKPQTVENDCDNFTFICVRLLDVRWTEPMEVFFSEHCWSSIHNGFGLIPINKLIKKFISIKMLN